MRSLPLLAFSASLLACNPGPKGYQPHPDRVARAVDSAEGDMGVVVAGHNDLAFALHGSFAQAAGDDNLFFSPFSIGSAFSMLLAGADTTTRDELAALLGADPAAEDAWHQSLGALTRDLDGDLHRAYTLHIANRLFGQSGYPFLAPFLDTCDQDYGAPLEQHDFATDPSGGRDRVNDWVEEQTQGRIVDLLPPNAVTPDTRLVLANAIYFLADWAVAFDPDLTQSSAFRRGDGSVVDVPMMTMDLDALEDPHQVEGNHVDGVGVLRLPYQEHEVSMVLLIPDAHDGLEALEASLDAARYAELTADLSPWGGVIGLPRLELRTELDLIPHLKGLGLNQVFSADTSDLSRLADVEEPLFVSAAFHQAFVRVDETGTEAAAATAVVVNRFTASAEPLIADRPFVVAIQDDLTGTILFLGRVTDPS